jgi:rhamnulokinase
LDVAKHLLMIPDLFHYWFTGIKVNELTDVSTSQMLNPATCTWATGLVQSFGLPTGLLGSIVRPATVLGPLRSSIVTETGLNAAPVIAVATHDTASAVAAVPAKGEDWAYISSGTWSLMGVELSQPLVGEASLAANFTNEIGFGGTVRYLKNIMGLWLVQECRRDFERSGRNYSYEELMHLAGQAPAFGSVLNPDDESFILPVSMPRAFADFCRRTNQPVPMEDGAIVRAALEALALRYRWVLEKLESLTGKSLRVIHIVGGGSQNALLCQLTADCCGREVLAGPVEATAIGNVLVQAIGLKVIGSLSQAREVVKASFEVKSYQPKKDDRWEAQYQKFRSLVG